MITPQRHEANKDIARVIDLLNQADVYLLHPFHVGIGRHDVLTEEETAKLFEIHATIADALHDAALLAIDLHLDPDQIGDDD